MNTETQRLVLLFALAMVVLMLWSAWQEQAAEPTAMQTTQPTATPTVPTAQPALPDLPIAGEATTTAAVSIPKVEPQTGSRILVKTDVLDVEVGMQGGVIHKLRLLNYPVAARNPDAPVTLVDSGSSTTPAQVQGGIVTRSGAPAPDHTSTYQSTNTSYRLQEGMDELRVPLYWDEDTGLSIEKTLIFRRGSYLVEVLYQIHNTGTAPWQGRVYAQLQRSRPESDGGFIKRMFTNPVYSYTGAVLSSPEDRYSKFDFEDLQNRALGQDIQDGWIAFLQHYFIGALLPLDTQDSYHYYSLPPSRGSYTIGSMSPASRLAAGESMLGGHRIYLGPKVQKDLKGMANGLELTVDYGWLWPISKFLFFLLSWLYTLTNNWGVAIILLTAIVKLAFFHLSATSYRSMANMRRLQPRIQSIRERHGDDRAAMQQAMMRLYREEKFNPFSGCLPILVQIPVFIALYWVLLESVELRQADFMLWLSDLSSRDPYFVLPILMGATMYVQQKLSPQSPDPIQRRVMAAFPPVFTLIIAFFPAGLVLYWFMNNLFSIAQQWYITRQIEQAA